MTHNSWPGAYTIKIYFLAQWQRWLSFHNPDQKMVFLDITLTKDLRYSQSLLLGVFIENHSTQLKNLQKNKTILFMKTNFAEQTTTRV
jgi:hypothetical protein